MQMALCFRNESAKTEPKRIFNGLLRSRKLYLERGEERERCHFSVIHFPYVNCSLRSKMESIAWVEAENEAPPI